MSGPADPGPPVHDPLALHLCQLEEADALLSRDPFALLIGMLLDQQVPMEKAFSGPYVIASRLGRDLDANDLAGLDPDDFATLCARTPAVHRFPGAMATRVQALSAHIAEHYAGDAEALWRDAPDAVTVRDRLQALPGFGDYKARIFLALLGKQLGVTPSGWREASAPYGDEGVHRSVADVTGPDSLAAVRAYKKEQKASSKAAAGTPTVSRKAAAGSK